MVPLFHLLIRFHQMCEVGMKTFKKESLIEKLSENNSELNLYRNIILNYFK